MIFQDYWQTTGPICHTKCYQELRALQLWLRVLCLSSVFHYIPQSRKSYSPKGFSPELEVQLHGCLHIHF